MTEDEIAAIISNKRNIYFDISLYIEECNKLKEKYLIIQDEKSLLKIWAYKCCFEIYRKYLNVFNLLKEREYYKAWEELEKIEISLADIRRNYSELMNTYLIDRIQEMVPKYQAIYPYRIFASPEYLSIKRECSICGSDLNPFTGCSHIIGNVYSGEMCYCIIHEAKLISISAVRNPVQKYSVMFAGSDDPTNYKLLEYLVPKLKSPLVQWDYTISNDYEPHSKYKICRNDRCPCLSGKKYKDCCLKNEKGVIFPHYEFYLIGNNGGR
jgi:hypothetical protein